MDKTSPKPRGIDKSTSPSLLLEGRYGTDDMIHIWGPQKTFEYSLTAQARAIETLSDLHPDIVPPDERDELVRAANLDTIDPQRIRELEMQTGHDIIAINSAWEEKVSPSAASHINKLRTSADTSESAKALQIKESLEVVADSLENLRDITLEKAMEWVDIPHIDSTHGYDALPGVAGRPFAFYAEMLQSDLDVLAFVYRSSIKGKWADATGAHHAADAMGINGEELEREYCRRLGANHMKAPAQIPGREFQTDTLYTLARTAETMNNLARYVRWGRSDDVALFSVPRKRKGSSSMPHKDSKGGNPTAEEQAGSYVNYMRGVLMSSLSSCTFDYARSLEGSASDRIIFSGAFKFGDHTIRSMADVIYNLHSDEKRASERFERTYGAVTAEQVMHYLTDRRRGNPMSRKQAHDLTARLATQAYDTKTPYFNVLLKSPEITSRLDEETICQISDPFKYQGRSKEQVHQVFSAYYKRKTL